jgi:hypothetical protein
MQPSNHELHHTYLNRCPECASNRIVEAFCNVKALFRSPVQLSSTVRKPSAWGIVELCQCPAMTDFQIQMLL